MEAANKKKQQHISRCRKKRMVINICQYLCILVGFGLFLSSPLWLPRLIFFAGHFFFVLLPAAAKDFVRPKCVFLLGNLIIVLLLGDSKLSYKASPPILDDVHRHHYEDDDDGDDLCHDEDEEKNALPADELKRRVEDFIARVNSQRSLEARLIAGQDA